MMRTLIRTVLLFYFLLFSIACFAQQSDKLSLSDKLYGLSKFWSEVNYNFVYKYKIDADLWDRTYKQAIENVQRTKTDYEYYRELKKLCAVLKDGHTSVYFPDQIQNKILTSNFGDVRMSLMNVEGKTLIVQTNKSQEKAIPFASEVVKVNGLATDEYQDKFVKPYISSSTQQGTINNASSQLLSGLEGDEYDIEIRTPKGQLKKLHLVHAVTAEKDVSPVFIGNKPPFELRWLQDKIAYIGMNTFDDAAIVKEFMGNLPEITKARSVIIDIRNNGGGSSKNAREIAKYFTAGNLIYGARNYSREIIPTDRALGSFLEAKDTVAGRPQWGLSASECKEYYKSYTGNTFHAYKYAPDTVQEVAKIKVPVVVLTSNYTASAAEDFLIYLDREKNITRVGDFTNGSTGQPLQVALPGGGSAWICTKKVTFSDGREFVGKGIEPHVIVKQTKNDILYPSKFDGQLKAAIEKLAVVSKDISN